MRELWIGLEHTNPRILNAMNKTNDSKCYAALADRIMNDATKIGIGLHFCHILGFPSETDEEKEEVRGFYQNNSDALSRKPFFVTFNIFGLMYNSQMYMKPEDYGISDVLNSSDGYYMISVPYKTNYNDETSNPLIRDKLFGWIQKYQKVIVNQEDLMPMWYNLTDTPFELLLKKYHDDNPFYKKILLK